MTDSKDSWNSNQPAENPQDVTRLLHEWADGDIDALNKVLPMVYDELRRVAQSQFKDSGPNLGLQATELVDMVYLKLVNSKQVRFESRKHFFWYASQIVRRLLVDHIRSVMSQKRGGGILESLDGDVVDINLQKPDESTLMALDEALSRLEKVQPQQCRIVEMRSFAGMTIDEIAEVMSVSQATVKREWSRATRWLHFQLRH